MDNTPGSSQVANLRALCANVLEPLRIDVDLSIVVTSGYRSEALNRRVDGAPKSQHLSGEAADVIIPKWDVKRAFKRVLQLQLPFDQLIYEGGRESQWVHVSHSRTANRGEILLASFPPAGGVKYKAITRLQALEI